MDLQNLSIAKKTEISGNMDSKEGTLLCYVMGIIGWDPENSTVAMPLGISSIQF